MHITSHKLAEAYLYKVLKSYFTVELPNESNKLFHFVWRTLSPLLCKKDGNNAINAAKMFGLDTSTFEVTNRGRFAKLVAELKDLSKEIDTNGNVLINPLKDYIRDEWTDPTDVSDAKFEDMMNYGCKEAIERSKVVKDAAEKAKVYDQLISMIESSDNGTLVIDMQKLEGLKRGAND